MFALPYAWVSFPNISSWLGPSFICCYSHVPSQGGYLVTPHKSQIHFHYFLSSSPALFLFQNLLPNMPHVFLSLVFCLSPLLKEMAQQWQKTWSVLSLHIPNIQINGSRIPLNACWIDETKVRSTETSKWKWLYARKFNFITGAILIHITLMLLNT